MADIVTQSTTDLVTITVTGILALADVTAVIAEHYPRLEGRPCLWDLRASDVHQLTSAEMEALALTVARATQRMETVKSAFLVADGRAYAKVCSYLSRDVRMRAPIEAAVFLREEEARRWVRQGGRDRPGLDQ